MDTTTCHAASADAASIADITQRVVDFLGASGTADMLGVNTSTIYRWRSGQKVPSQTRIETALRTAYSACLILSNLTPEQTRSWFLTPNRDLGYHTPQSLVSTDGAAVLQAADVTATREGRNPS